MFHGNISKPIAEGLKALQQRIEAAKIPSSKLDETLNLATWNIREFGKSARSEAAIHYIAEILGQFDLVSVVELRDNLGDLGRVLNILGPYWRALYSDALVDDKGNSERIGIIYDKRAVVPTGLATSVNPPREMVDDEVRARFSWWRLPYMASFRAGNFDFVAVTAHIRWGAEAGRLKEIASFAEWFDLKRRERNVVDRDVIVTGDFNIANKAMLDALTGTGLKVPQSLRKADLGTTLASGKRYDHILHLPIYPESFMNKGGVLDFYCGDHAPLFPGLSFAKFTHQMSDHLPLWVQINTDNDSAKLDQIIQGGK